MESKQRRPDGRTKRNQQIGKIKIDRGGGGGEREDRKSMKKKRGRESVPLFVRGTLLSEPVTVVAGTASVCVIRQRVSGSSPSHFVPPLTASRPDCLTDWKRDGAKEDSLRSLSARRKLAM